jgi:hypothetical protein
MSLREKETLSQESESLMLKMNMISGEGFDLGSVRIFSSIGSIGIDFGYFCLIFKIFDIVGVKTSNFETSLR